MPDASSMLVVLDVDETLVSSTLVDGPQLHSGSRLAVRVVPRPHVAEFLRVCTASWPTGIWSAGSPAYVSRVLELVCPAEAIFRFVWAHDRCTWAVDRTSGECRWRKPIKKLRRLGWPVDRIVAIDDDPSGWDSSYGNCIPIRSFTGDGQDRELLDVLGYLRWLDAQASVRSIDHRRWRSREAANGKG